MLAERPDEIDCMRPVPDVHRRGRIRQLADGQPRITANGNRSIAADKQSSNCAMKKRVFLDLISAFLIGIGVSGANAYEPLYPDAPKPVAVPKKGDSDAVTESKMVMGLRQTQLWTRLRWLVADTDYLFNFEKLSVLLDLDVQKPYRTVTPASAIGEFIENTDASGRIRSLAYGIRPNPSAPSKKGILLTINFNPAQVCIPAQEVRRVFGPAIGVPPADTGVPPLVDGLPVGVSYALKYPQVGTPQESELTFGISPGGCVDKMIVVHPIP